MANTNWKQAGKTAGKAAIIVGGVGLGVWIGIILSDLLTFIWLFWSIDNVMESYGLPEYLGKLVALGFAAPITYYLGKVLWYMVKRDKRWVIWVTGFMAAWFVVMYAVSSPYNNGLFNPFNGKAQAKYVKMPSGEIKKFPVGIKYDPDSGRPLTDFDTATADEYNKQSGGKKQVWTLPKVFKNHDQVYSNDDYTNLVLWAEKIQIAPDRTIVHLACKMNRTWGEDYPGRLKEADPSDIYLSDAQGRIYHPSNIVASYEYRTDCFFCADYAFHEVMKDEIYRFSMTFPVIIRGPTRDLRYHDSRFGDFLDLDDFVTKAEHIGSEADAQAKPTG